MSSARKKKDKSDRKQPAVLRPELLPVEAGPMLPWWLATLGVFVAALAAYSPTLDNQFINWDTREYVVMNDYVAESGGLKRIWDPAEKHEQYYPLVFTSYWLEHRILLWQHGESALESVRGVPAHERGFEPWIFHLTNMVLHAINAALVVWLLRMLGLNLRVALAAALLFAVHPINTASVAWVAERKNVLSGLFYLLALLLYMRTIRRWSWPAYSACLLMFVAALLSKSATLTLPATAMFCDWVIRRRWSVQSALRIAPMLILGVVSAYVTIRTEAGNSLTPLESPELLVRPFVAAGAVWFYVGKLLVPTHLAGAYLRWDVSGAQPIFLAAMAALVGLGALLWKMRRRVPSQAMWGLAHFLITLTPMLGLVAFNYTRYSFVANHFVYLAAIGVFLCLAMLFDWLMTLGWRSVSLRWPLTIAGWLLIVALGFSTHHTCQTVWKDGASYWTHTLSLNPDFWPGYYNLGNGYGRRANRLRAAGDQESADRLLLKSIDAHGQVIRINPSKAQSHGIRAKALLDLKRHAEAIESYKLAIKYQPLMPLYHKQLADCYEATKQGDEAVEQYRALIKNRIIGDAEQVRIFLWSHLMLGQHQLRRGQAAEAVHLYQAVLDFPNQVGWSNDDRRIKQQIDDAQRAMEIAKRSLPGL